MHLDLGEGRLSVRNNGRGIRVERHPEEGIWLPEMVLGSLYTGSNFDDTQLRTVGGRHGFGAKLANIFAESFEVETADTKARAADAAAATSRAHSDVSRRRSCCTRSSGGAT